MGRTVLWAVVALCACSGCTSHPATRFRVVDAVTGSPVPGVHATAKWGMWQPAAPGLFPVYIPFSAGEGISDKTGMIELKGPANEVELTGPGYMPCSLVSGWSCFRQRGNPFDFESSSWENDMTALIRLKPLRQ